MLIISDTNILSSLAASDALPLLFRLFPNNVIYMPPAVQQELRVGLERGQAYLQTILDAVTEGHCNASLSLIENSILSNNFLVS